MSVCDLMVDVRLLCPKDKYEPAVRLAEALEAAGYELEREAVSGAFPDVAAEAGKAKALLLIWSRELVSAAMAGPGLALARRNPKLIELSADGIEPAGAEASPVILLCGWRGQPYHQGWQRILAEVKRRCGPGEAPAKGPRPALSGHSPSDPAKSSVIRRAPVRAAVAAGALIAATLGAVALYEWGEADSGVRTPPMAAAVGDAPRPAGTSAGSVPPVAVAAPAQARPGGALPAVATASETPGAPAAAQAATAERIAASRPAAIQRRSREARLAAAPSREVKRYSRKYSKTMRLFCQRSGRSTPQCRTFARSMRDLDG